MGLTDYYAFEKAIISRLEQKLTNIPVISVRDTKQIAEINAFSVAVVVAMGDDIQGESSVRKSASGVSVSVNTKQRFYITIISNDIGGGWGSSFNNADFTQDGEFIMEMFKALSGFEPSLSSGYLVRNFDDNTSYSENQTKKMFGFECRMLYSTNLE